MWEPKTDDENVEEMRWRIIQQLKEDAVVCLMLQGGVPLNRENYIRLAFLGEQTDDLDAEYESELPELFLKGFSEAELKIITEMFYESRKA
jgi:hypothetical protein